MRRRRSGLRLGAAGMAVVLGALLAAPAHAGETQAINTRDGLVGDDAGWGKGEFTVEFLNKRLVDIGGWVKDMCPGDDQGIYVSVHTVRITRDQDSGQLRYHHRRDDKSIGSDTNGCGNGRVTVDPAPLSFGRKLQMISIKLCERDASRPRHEVECWAGQFDNWRTWPN